MARGFLKFIPVVILAALAVSCSGQSLRQEGRKEKVYSAGETPDLKKADSIKGTVYDSTTKKPVPGARIEIKNANLGVGYYLLKTDSAGKFEVRDFIPHLNYIIEIEADGYVNYRSGGTVSPGTHDIFIEREAILSGTISDSGGRPLDGVEVRLQMGYSDEYSSYTRKPLVTKSGMDGRYSFNKLPQSPFNITFNKPGFIQENASIMNIKRGETFTLPMLLYRPSTLSGKIEIEGLNAPAINVSVSAKGKFTHSSVTYHDGGYQITDLKPGRYSLEVYHEGFYKLDPRIIMIKEGSEYRDVDFAVSPKKPEVNIYTYRYTFSPGNSLSFNLRTFRLETIKAVIYKVPIETFLKGKSNPNDIDPARENFKIAASWDETIQDFKPYQWRYQTLDIKVPLPTGGYCIEARGAGNVIDRKYFTVTSVGIVAKRSQYRVMAYVTDLVTGLPVEGASLAVFDSTPAPKKKNSSGGETVQPQRIEDLPINIIANGITGRDGLYINQMKSDRLLSILAMGKDGSYAICNTGSPSAFQKEKNRYMVYTDRPVYRAGDRVYFKIIGKKREQRFVPMSDETVHYQVINRETSKDIGDGSFAMDDWGTADGSIDIDPEGSLGMHEIKVGPAYDSLYGSGRFYVEQYRKPEFKIDITPSKEYFINGDSAEFKVEGKYFFGAPIKNALVKFRFYETRLRDSDTNYWWEEDENDEGRDYRKLKLEGEKYLDDNGIATLSLHSGNFPYDREITLEATVVDKSNVSITSMGSVRVGRGEYYIKIEPGRNFFAGNEKKEVTLRTLTHTGRPMSAKVSISLFRYIWKPYQRIYVHDSRPFFSTKTETDSKGTAVINLPLNFSDFGEFDIVVTGSDSRTNSITASRVVWIYNHAGGTMESRFKNLELTVNSAIMEKPGKLTCLIKSRFADGHVLLTVEGKDIYHSEVVRMKGNVMPVEIDVKGDYAPNFFITASMQQKRALFTVTSNVSLPVVDTGLRINVEPDRERYMPGEKTVIHIKVTDEKGGPLKADLSLSAVDESIYQIRPDHTPKMQDFFYSRISNWVLTGYSFPITILAGAGKESKVKIREKFMDTAFWKGTIRTDGSGKASVSFDVPDNLTTWRLTARGHDMIGRVGEKKRNFLVTQDLVARIGRPRFMVEGDDISLIAIVNSNTERGLAKVDMDLSANGRALKSDTLGGISLPGYGSARLYYDYQVPSGSSTVDLQMKAIADRDARDGLKVAVPVEKRGSLYKFYGYGDMVSNRSVDLQPLKETGDFSFVPDTLVVSLNPSPVMQMLKAVKFLTDYPYGCVEQTINRFIPVLALHELLMEKKMGHLIDEKLASALPDMAASGISKLESSQNDDGSWGWWAGDRGNGFVTGYAMYTLHLAEKYRYPVSKETVKKGILAVRRMLNETGMDDPDAKAFLLYILSLKGGWSDSALKFIEDRKDQNPYMLAFTLKALSALTPPKNKNSGEFKNILVSLDARKAVASERLRSLQKKDDRGIYWNSTGSQNWGWPGSDTEITAHVLSALVESGDRSPLAGQIVRSLAKRGRDDSWYTTKQTAAVIISMSQYLKISGGVAGESASVDFKLNGEKMATIRYSAGELHKSDDLVKRIPLTAVMKKGPYKITAEGNAGSDANFDVTLHGTISFKPSGFLSIFRSEEKSLSKLSNGLAIHRSFAAITRVRDMNRNEYLVPGAIDGSRKINVGDELLVKVKFTATEDFEYLVLEDYLPSGFEVINRNPYDSYRPHVREELRDNRMIFFFNSLIKGTVYEVAYILRAELPGKFMVRPSRMECMYEPSVQGWSAPAVIMVQPK